MSISSFINHYRHRSLENHFDSDLESSDAERVTYPYTSLEGGSETEDFLSPNPPTINSDLERFSSSDEEISVGRASSRPIKKKAIKRPKVTKLPSMCKLTWQTTLPFLLISSTTLTALNATTWGNSPVEVLSAAGLGATVRLYSHYCTPKKVAQWVNPFFASLAAEGLFAFTNLYLNLDDICEALGISSNDAYHMKTSIRVITYASMAFFVAHNILNKPRKLPKNEYPWARENRKRQLMLGEKANKWALTVHYLALASFGSALIIASQQMPENSKKILHVDYHAGILTLSYTAANFICRYGLKAHDWMIENRYKYKEYLREIEDHPKTLKNRLLSIGRRTLDTVGKVLPGILFPFNATLSYSTLGCLGAVTRVLQERDYERLDSQTGASRLEITARKTEYVKTGVLSLALLAFTIACIMTNDWHTGSAMLTLGLTSAGGYITSKAVELLISQLKWDNRLINQLDFELNVNSYGILFLYLFLHTKFMLLNSDVAVSSGFEYMLLLSMYGLLGFNLGNNRARFDSIRNLNPENASPFALTQLANNSMEYALK
jgi:hypothetical protein